MQWIEFELNKRGWKKIDLAKHAGISAANFTNFSKGYRRPGTEVCRSIARALKIPEEIVFHQAGLFTPSDKETEIIKQISYKTSLLSPEEQKEILMYTEMRIKIAEERVNYDSNKKER